MAWLSSGSKMSEKPTETYLGTSLRKLAPKPDQICRQPRRFHQYPRFESGGSRIATRLYPINLPLGPKRPHSALRRPPALGLGCVWGLKEEDEAPGSTSLPPIQRPKHEEDKQELSITKHIEHERCADAVKYRRGRNAPGPELWQRVGCQWEHVQCRPNQYRLYETAGCPPLKLLPREDDEPQIEEQERTILPEIDQTSAQKKEQFARPMPGYGGYIPRYPVEARPPKNLVNISKMTYRAVPPSEYKRQVYAHQGPLSKTVTTAPPFNPFNKIDNWDSRPKKLLWKRDNRVKFVGSCKK